MVSYRVFLSEKKQETRALRLHLHPEKAAVRLLVQNAAIGDPAPFEKLDLNHFEEHKFSNGEKMDD